MAQVEHLDKVETVEVAGVVVRLVLAVAVATTAVVVLPTLVAILAEAVADLRTSEVSATVQRKVECNQEMAWL
jgi:hypothetical protein